MSNMNKRLAGNNSNSEQQPSVASDESGSTNSNPEEAKCVGRKRTIDESILEADELRKLESRRAYNRQCAAKGTLVGGGSAVLNEMWPN